MSLQKENRLGVLLATFNEGIYNVQDKMLPQLKNCDVFISHQVTDDKYIQKNIANKNVRYDVLHSVGLSKNRNNCLKNMQNEINLIADDDLEYIPGFEKIILEAFEKNKEADIITFQIEGKVKFPNKQWHNMFTIVKVSSVTIAFRASAIKKSGIIFNEKFGLGAPYPQGEENIFLKDCLDAGLKILADPQVIVKHPHASSGENFDDRHICAKTLVFTKMYGTTISFVFMLYFAIKKMHTIRSSAHYLKVGLACLIKGSLQKHQL